MVTGQAGIKKFEVTSIVFLAIAALVIIQVISLVLSQAGFESADLKLGPAFLVIITGIAVWAAFELVRQTNVLTIGVGKPSLLMIGIITIIVVASYIYLPQAVPEIFEDSAQSLAAMLIP